jgi:hypothetical protein
LTIVATPPEDPLWDEFLRISLAQEMNPQ